MDKIADKNEDYIIRDFKQRDFPMVEKIWAETDLGGKERGDSLNIIFDTIKSGGRLLVMENNKSKDIIGTSWLTVDGRRMHMHHFGIKPSFQKQGLAKLLLKESLKFAGETRLQIKIEVHKSNIHALNLYQKYGFKQLGDYEVLIIRNPLEI